MPQTIPQSQLAPLAECLRAIENRLEEYPPEVCASAIDGLLQIEVLLNLPLSEADWQGE